MLAAAAALVALGGVPRPNARQLEYMEDVDMVQFMHYSLPTYWNPGSKFLHGGNPTYHNCKTQDKTTAFAPCMDPDWFQPTHLDTDAWMQDSLALGFDEICLTARHEGGFTMWPSKATPYGVHASSWRNGTGDVLKEFVASAKKYGIKICYYFNPAADGYSVRSKAGPHNDVEKFVASMKGQLTELLTQYGPVNRLWFDGTSEAPEGINRTEVMDTAFELTRSLSPATLLSPYGGDIRNNAAGTVYTSNGAPPNGTTFKKAYPTGNVSGRYFYPTEQHGITMQMGPDGATTGELPTFWFWHDWACVGNRAGCPWVGHVSAASIFEAWVNITGQGNAMLFNVAPDKSGVYNASVAATMRTAGAAINATFRHGSVASAAGVPASGRCEAGMVTVDVDPEAEFDYVLAREDLSAGQRIANYSVEYQPVGGDEWLPLVPPVPKQRSVVGDTPSGQGARDSHVGKKRIDVPEMDGRRHRPGVDAPVTGVRKVRFNCLGAYEEPVHIRQLSLHRRRGI